MKTSKINANGGLGWRIKMLKTSISKGLKYFLILISCFLSLISFHCSENLVGRDLNSKVSDSIFIYEIKMNHSLSEMKILRLQTYKYKKFINGQDLITYDYFDSIEKVDSKIYEEVSEDGIRKIYHDEMTGQIKMKKSHWMHPPPLGQSTLEYWN